MASLVLDDGTVFKGVLFGAARNSPGEVGMFCSTRQYNMEGSPLRSTRNILVLTCFVVMLILVQDS